MSTIQFITALEASFENASFIKLTLGAYKGTDPDLKNIHIRKIIIKREEKLSFTYRYKTRDIVKNYGIIESIEKIEEALSQGFEAATLFTSQNDIALDRGNIKTSKPTQKLPESLDHDRAKIRPVNAEGKPYLHALNITDAQGTVYKAAQDKFRQINKYVETMSGLLKNIPPARLTKIIDMGSGKGYLTFALTDYLAEQGVRPEVIGVEYRADLVDMCNKIAREQNFKNLSFVQSGAADYDCTGASVMIALHACDTATDDAIHKGITACAELIVVAPCCHKQIRREMEKGKTPADLEFLLKHGIFMEREAEMVTDGLRAQILEYYGYDTKIFEFISGEHTVKNIMIVAEKNNTKKLDPVILQHIKNTKFYFGISHHHLERLLNL